MCPNTLYFLTIFTNFFVRLKNLLNPQIKIQLKNFWLGSGIYNIIIYQQYVNKQLLIFPDLWMIKTYRDRSRSAKFKIIIYILQRGSPRENNIRANTKIKTRNWRCQNASDAGRAQMDRARYCALVVLGDLEMNTTWSGLGPGSAHAEPGPSEHTPRYDDMYF